MENKTSRYFKYAAGEIILVVIGILIALQINTWNQNRLDRIERKRIVKNLNSEFSQNKRDLTKIVDRYRLAKNSGMKMMEFVGVEQSKNYKQKEIDSLMDQIFATIDYLPSNNAIQEVIQSGKLKTLDNSKLLNKLSEWQSLIYICSSREEKIERWIFNQMLPYLNRHMSWRDAGVVNGYNWSTKGTIPANYSTFLTDLEFENLLENHLFFLNECLVRYSETVSLVDEIIILTSQYD